MRGNIEQGLAERVKTARALIRLKHSLAADREVNATLDDVKKAYIKKVQSGALPESINLDKVLRA